MSDRAKYLAKILLQRMGAFEAAGLDAQVEDELSEQEESALRYEVVGKALLAELGTAEFALTHLVLSAMPRVVAGVEPTSREVEEFAQFLETHLGARLLQK